MLVVVVRFLNMAVVPLLEISSQSMFTGRGLLHSEPIGKLELHYPRLRI